MYYYSMLIYEKNCKPSFFIYSQLYTVIWHFKEEKKRYLQIHTVIANRFFEFQNIFFLTGAGIENLNVVFLKTRFFDNRTF